MTLYNVWACPACGAQNTSDINKRHTFTIPNQLTCWSCHKTASIRDYELIAGPDPEPPRPDDDDPLG